MSEIADIVEIVVVSENEDGQRIEYHFPVDCDKGDKAVASYSTEYVPGNDIPIGRDFTVHMMDTLRSIRLEVLADLQDRKTDARLFWWAPVIREVTT